MQTYCARTIKRTERCSLALCMVILLLLLLSAFGLYLRSMGMERDPMDTYRYVHTKPEHRELEEQLVRLTEKYLDECVYFQSDPTRLYTLEGMTRTDRFYDPELRAWFAESVMGLIPRIPELGTYGVYFELRAILAQLHSGHAWLYYNSPEGFPVTYWSFDREDGYDIHLVQVPKTMEELLFAKVTEVNGLSVAEVIGRMKPYVSWENESGLRHELFRNGEFSFVELWEHIGILDPGAQEMTLTLELADGTDGRWTFPRCSREELGQTPMAGWKPGNGGTLTERNGHLNYWYEWRPEDRMLYVRFHEMEEREDLPLEEMTAGIRSLAAQTPQLENVVVDYRNNLGGKSDLEGFDQLVETIGQLKAQVYILTDQDTFSAAVMCAAQMDIQIEHAVLVGMPTAEPAYVHGAVRYSFGSAKYCVPRSTWIYIDDGRDALYPEVTIPYTIDDFRTGTDPVLDYIRTQ